MLPYQYFKFSQKSYTFYSQGVWTFCEKTNIFNPVSNGAVEVLSLKVVVI